MIEAASSRLEAKVPDLAGRVGGAADYAKVRRSGLPPSGGPAAYLIPLGLRGGTPDASAGIFSQDFAEMLGVILVFSSTDRTGERALTRLRDILFEVIGAFAGWAPGEVLGVFQLTGGRLIDATGGVLTYEIDFSITDQLRITP